MVLGLIPSQHHSQYYGGLGMSNSKLGRPSDYSQELADLICERIATHGVGLKKLCEMYEDIPEKITIRRWCIKDPQFRSQYARPKYTRSLCEGDKLILTIF